MFFYSLLSWKKTCHRKNLRHGNYHTTNATKWNILILEKKNYQIRCSHEEVIPTTKVSSRLKRKGWCHIQWGAPIGVDHSGLQPFAD